MSSSFQNADMFFNMGVAYSQKAEYDKAIQCYQKVISLNPNDADAYNNMGNDYSKKGEHAKAIECFQRVIMLQPTAADAYTNMGASYAELQDLGRAIECHEKAIELKPEYAAAHFNLGNAYQDQGFPDKAIDCYQKAIALRPAYPAALYNLGIIYSEKQNLLAARECFNQAAELGHGKSQEIIAKQPISTTQSPNATIQKNKEWARTLVEQFISHLESTARLKCPIPSHQSYFRGIWALGEVQKFAKAQPQRKGLAEIANALEEAVDIIGKP